MRVEALTRSRGLFILFRLLIGFIFIYAGIEKILAPAEFAEAIDNYRMLPAALINILAITLPWIELITGVLLIVGFFIKGSSLILLGLLLIFAVAITINIIRGVDISCGCKTPWDLSDKISLRKLIEEIILFLMVLQIFLHSSTTLCLDSFFQFKLEPESN